MSSINMEIAKEGKKLRNRIFFDVFEPAINYSKVVELIHHKQMAQKQFLLKYLYKQI